MITVQSMGPFHTRFNALTIRRKARAMRSEPRLGAHLSIAGGLPLAIARAVGHGCRSLQIFTRSASQWRARPLDAAEVAEFRARARAAGMRPIVAHASYLINLASGDRTVRARSRRALAEELDRAEALGLFGVVLHPGSATGGRQRVAVRRIADGLDALLRARPKGRALVILEQTAGQGTSVGHRFEHLAEIIAQAGASPRLGVCLDTCHLLAAGYDIASREGYEATIAAFDRVVGLDRLALLHLNDSKHPLGSRVDRHEHIGQGHVGLDGFARILRDPRLSGVPMIIETPKTGARAPGRGVALDPLDRMNLATLRRLLVAEAVN
jgi:deoxyribonuclease-4